MSSIDRIKRKRKELEIERSDVSNINKSIGKINILRDEISTTGGIDYGDIAPIRTNSNTNNVSNNVSTDLNALQEKRKSLQSQLVNYERKKNDDYWWDKDKNIISNIGNVAKKLFVDSDRKNKYAKDDKYDSLLKEYNDTIKAIETVSLDNKTYKGFSGSVDKVSDTILGNAVTSRKGIESTVKKILGQTPTDEETTLTYEEMLAQKARQETTGAGGVGLDILGSVTRMLPQMMVGNSTGALAMGFANYGGSAYNQARQEGATEKQATAYGVISGSLEMMLNKILPSYNIGGKNVYGKTLTDNIMNQVVTNSAFKNFVFRTVNDAAGEFTEEYLQEFLEPIIKNTVLQQDNGADFWNTMKDDVDKGLKQLGSQLFNKENLYAGSLGALTSGIMGFQSNTDAYRYEKRTGRNAETGLTANEQSVMNDEVNKRTVEAQKKAAVDSEVNKIIKEQEKTFGTLTDAEKAGIKNQVQEKLDNGEIDFTTLKLKNSEIKTIENRVKEDLQKGYIDIDTIENTLTQEKTVQIKELEQRLRNIANEQEKTQIEEKLNQLRIDRANDLKNKLRQDIYLQESYAELARKSEKFTYEAKKTDSEIKKNLAEDFKKIANNTNKSHETFETISKIAEDRGVSYGVINNEQLKQLGYDIEGKNVNGLVRTMQDGKQKVLVNLDSDKAINTIVGHETTHLLEGTKEYTNFQEYIKNYAKTKGEYNTRYKELSNLYRGVNANIETEVTADLVGDYLFTDTDFVRNLSVESPTIFKQVYDYIKHVYNLATAGSKEKRQLEQVKYKFEEAYKQSNVQVNNGIQYSMIGEKGALNATNINSKNQFLLTNLEKAKSMAKSGKSNDEIFKATGWFKQYGKWKFEISDSILDGVTINNVKKNHEYLLSDILNHKDLFIAYEDLKNTKVSFADLKNYNGYMVGGQYDAKKKNIELNNKLLDTKNPDKAIKQVLMHEVQHKIQQYEGFKNGSTGLLGEEAYKRSKGEIESRETEKRLEMSYEQRNNKIPEAVHSRMDSIPELLYNKFGKEKSVYDNNIDTDSIVDINGDFINKKSNEILEGSDAERIFRGNRKKQKELDNSSFSLDQRVSGDALLDAQDFIDEVKSVGAEVDDNSYVTVYHQTSDENADKIRQSGKMIANEDYVYFSTSKNATQSEGRGQTKLEFKIPAEKLMLDDIFSDNADVKIPLKGKKTLDVSNYLVNDTKYSISDTDNKGRTLSNEQMEYFKDSKAVDENGNLKVLYHGTGTTIDEFKTEFTGRGNDQYGSGFYFTDNQSEAEGYKTSITEKLGGTDNPNVIASYLNIKKPIIADGSNLSNSNIEMTHKQTVEIIKKAPNLYDVDESPIGNWHDVWNDGVKDYMIDDVATHYEGDLMSLENDFFHENATEFRQAVCDATGYDGVIHTYGNGNTHYVAWFPNQIKSIDNANPTLENANIFRSLSNQNEIAPRNSKLTYGEDIKFQEKPVIEEISPVKTGNAPEGYNALTEEDLPYLEQQYNETPREDTAPPKPEIDAEDSGIPMRRVKPEQTVNDEIARILTEEPKKQDTRNKRKWAIFKANVLDKGSVFEDLSLKAKNRDLMGKWDYTLSSQARAQNVIGNGHTEYDAVTKTTKQTSKSLNDIRAEVDNTGMTQDFYNYMYHKHNVDRMNLSNRFEGVENKPVFGEGITSEISQQIVNEYENAHPEFIDYANDVYDYVNADRQQLVNEGVISQETADLWQEMYPHYVPIRRVDKNGVDINVPLDTRRTGVNAPIKKATGGSSDILPLFDTMAMRTLQTYRATAKNSFGVELKNTLNTNTEVNKTNVDEVIDSVDNQEGLLQEGKNGKNPTFTVFVNGEKVTYDITQDMYDALKPISDSSILSKTFTPFNAVSNFHRGVLTQYNLFFALTNAVKDAQDVLMNSQHAAKTYSKIPEAWSQQLKKGYWYQEYMANGGEQNSYFDSRDNTFNPEKKGLYKLTDMFPLKTIATINDFIEMTPRLAEYIASREAGRSIEVSMLDAARVTTNFKAGGDLTKWANRNGATFLNASVQGFNQQIRNIREANAKGLNGWATLATKFAVAGLPALLLNALLWGDDDDYEELSDYVKQNYYIVAKYGDGEFIRIPKGRTLAVIQNAMEQVQKASKGDEEADFKEFISLFLNNLAPNNPIENNVLSPIIQAATNKAWYGGDLVPTRLQDMPTAEQYDESTDTFSKWLGEKLNVSPYKINYVMNQYTGFLGDMFMPMMTPEAKNDADSVGDYLIAPLKDKFTADSTMNNKYTGELFETSEELTTNSRKSNVTDEDVLKNKFINSMKREMNELYKQKREIQNSNLSKSEKYNQVREIQKEINELSKYGLDNYKDVQITGNYATVGNREYRLTTNTEGEETWNKITDKQKAKQEEVSNALGINASDYWGNKEEYDYAYENPGNYGISKVIGGYETFKAYSKELNDIKSDKDSNGKTIANSRKQKVFDYINSTDLNFEQRVMLAKLEYPSYDEYNNEIIEYLNNSEDISYEEEVEILKQLGFEVDSYGNISW